MPATAQPSIDPVQDLAGFAERLEGADASAIERLIARLLRRLAAALASLIEDFRAAPGSPQGDVRGFAPELEPEPRRRAPVTRTPAPPPSLLQRGWGWLRRLMPGKPAFAGQAEDSVCGPEIAGPEIAGPATGAIELVPSDVVADAWTSPSGDMDAPSSPSALPEAADSAPPALGLPQCGLSPLPVSNQSVFGISRPSPQPSPEGEGETQQMSPLSRVREREGVRATVETFRLNALRRRSPAPQRTRCAGPCFPPLTNSRRGADPPANFFQSA